VSDQTGSKKVKHFMFE